jgi:hypothetical protein
MICRDPNDIGDRDSIEILRAQHHLRRRSDLCRDVSDRRTNNYLIDRDPPCLLRAVRNGVVIMVGFLALAAVVVWIWGKR